MTSIIPLEAIPNQRVTFTANEASFAAEIVTRDGDMYISLWRNTIAVLHNRALRSYAPIGFGMIMVDLDGLEDPVFTGLGSRWQFMVEAYG